MKGDFEVTVELAKVSAQKFVYEELEEICRKSVGDMIRNEATTQSDFELFMIINLIALRMHKMDINPKDGVIRLKKVLSILGLDEELRDRGIIA